MSRESPIGSGIQTIFTIIAAIFLIIFAAIICLFLYFWFVPPKFLVDADEGFKKAKATIDPEPLRAWALAEIKIHYAAKSPEKIRDIEIPKSIRSLYSEPPENFEVETNCVTIFWGGGFFHWMIDVGDTNFSEPYRNDNPEVPYNFEWTNGVYYSREANWKKLQ
jgi:hypothetical protein